jgi:hypothetical protein
MGVFLSKTYNIDESNLYDFINKLMRGIFSKIDFVDLFSMMDADKCNDYIIFGEKSIQKIFIKMNLKLGRDDDDKIFIRKASTLRDKLGQEDVHKIACKDVAKFIAQVLRLIATIVFMLKIRESDEAPLENSGRSATGEISKESRSILSYFGVGGEFNFKKPDNTKLKVRGNNAKDVFLKYFKVNPDKTVYLEHTQTNISSLITLVPERLKLNGCRVADAADAAALGSPLVGAPQPPPAIDLGAAGETIPLLQYLNDNRSYICADVSNEDDDDNSSKYVMTYKFNLDKQNQYAFSFSVVFSTENLRSLLVMNNFEWVETATPPDATDLRSRKPTTMQCAVAPGTSNLVVINGRGETKSIQTYIYDKCKEIERESWNNPEEDTASKYLIQWRYLLPERGSERYVPLRGTNEIIFDEETRETPKGVVLYKKSVQVSNRLRDITFACEISIDNKGLQSDGQFLYSLTVHNIQMETAIQGINFEPISELDPRNFRTRNKSVPPTDTESNTVPQFLKQVLSKNIARSGASGRTYRYLRPQEGERMYKIPEDKTRQDDLGILQRRMLSVDTLPACSARARELLTKIGDNRYLSSVCNAKFKYRVNGSLPKTREITGSYGIDALRSLFKFVDESAPNLNKSAEWEQFKKNMERVGGYELRARCDSKFADGMELPLDVANDVRGVVQELVAMEKQKISTMLNLLFQIISKPALDQNREVKLDERLFEEGMPRVLEITQNVIEAAKNYYIQCDTVYERGLKRILASEGSKVPERRGPAKGGPKREEEENDDEANANDLRGRLNLQPENV